MSNELILSKGKKVFKIGNEKIYALNNVSITIRNKTFYAIMGHSGAGKSTLIQILGLLDSLSEGELYLNGEKIQDLSENEKARIRMEQVGFVFQSFHLNPKLKAIENVMLPI